MGRLSTDLEKQSDGGFLSKVPSLEDEAIEKLEEGQDPTTTPVRNDGLLTDWKEGIVGWDSDSDPENPQ